MVGQRLGRWRGEAGHREVGAAAKRGLRRWAAAVARNSLRPWPRRGCSDAGNDRHSGLLASGPLSCGGASLGGGGRLGLRCWPLVSPFSPAASSLFLPFLGVLSVLPLAPPGPAPRGRFPFPLGAELTSDGHAS
jgi:hypothetical protein